MESSETKESSASLSKYRHYVTRFSPGGHREREIPDPIPNSEVKPFFADGTILKSMEE
jgi:hypothetical protein